MTRTDVRGHVVALGAWLHVAHARRGASQRASAIPAGIDGLGREGGTRSHVGGRFAVRVGDEDGLGGKGRKRFRIGGRFVTGLGGEDGFGGREEGGGVGELGVAENNGVGVVVGGIGGGVEDGDELVDEVETGGHEVEPRDASEQHVHR